MGTYKKEESIDPLYNFVFIFLNCDIEYGKVIDFSEWRCYNDFIVQIYWYTLF